MKKMINILFVILGALIGAGFASGQEINIFFFQSGINGIYGIIISSVLIGIVIYKSLKIIRKNDIKTYKDFLDIITNTKREINLKNIINIIINIFILISFFIMIAGFGAYLKQELGINEIIGSTILAILCIIIFKRNVEGLVKVSSIIVPILIFSLILIGIINIKHLDIANTYNILMSKKDKFILKAVLYCSYNSILLIPVLITLKKYITSNKQIKVITFFSIIFIVLLSILIFFILTRNLCGYKYDRNASCLCNI